MPWLLAILLVACGAGVPTTTTNVTAVAGTETFDGLALGVSETELDRLLGPAVRKDAPAEEAATGLWVSRWTSPARGVEVRMVADSARGAVVDGFVIVSPSKLRSSRGIGIGSTHREVENAYERELAGPPPEGGVVPESSPEAITIGVTHGGISFEFEHGIVKKISVDRPAI